MDLTVGEKFRASVNDGPVSNYVKIQEVRMSCCHVLNAALLSDEKQRVQILPLTEVERIPETTTTPAPTN